MQRNKRLLRTQCRSRAQPFPVFRPAVQVESMSIDLIAPVAAVDEVSKLLG
jgi:hypothetical protein